MKKVLIGTIVALSLSACGTAGVKPIAEAPKTVSASEAAQADKMAQEEKAKQEAKLKLENEARLKLEAENKAQADAEAKLKAEQEAAAKLLIVDVKSFKGKTPTEIEAIYGKPDNIEKGNWGLKPNYNKVPYERYVYDTKGFSVMFIEGVAGRMEVFPKDEMTTEQIQTNSMQMLGLPPTKVDNDQRNIVRWLPKEGAYQITAIFTDVNKKELESINVVLDKKYD